MVARWGAPVATSHQNWQGDLRLTAKPEARDLLAGGGSTMGQQTSWVPHPPNQKLEFAGAEHKKTWHKILGLSVVGQMALKVIGPCLHRVFSPDSTLTIPVCLVGRGPK